MFIGPSEPMQNNQTCFFSNIFLKFYNIIKIIIQKYKTLLNIIKHYIILNL
jgi:hypothetical protein